MRLLVIGRTGQVARALIDEAAKSGVALVAVGRPDLDLAQPASLVRAIDDARPDVVVNAGAYTAVDKAEAEPESAFAVNATGAGAIAAAAAAAGLPLIHLSTDYVFSGDKMTPYTEDDRPDPQSVYGRSKLQGEGAVALANPAHVILRTAWIHAPQGANFVRTMLRLAGERDAVSVVGDQRGTPTYAPDIAEAIFAVARRLAAPGDRRAWYGVFHMVATGETSWAGFAEAVFAASAARGGPSARVVPITTADYPTPARRPANSRLDSSRFNAVFDHVLPSWQSGVERCVQACLGGPVGARTVADALPRPS
jgi:dTDP-4-dehydrorhamnose reductase